MIRTGQPATLGAQARRGLRIQFRVWHLTLLVAFVAVAIVNIQDQRRSEPWLVGLASAGFVVYGLIGCLVWHLLQPFERRLGRVLLLMLYITGMSLFFLGATVAYLVLEYRYLVGHF